MQYAGSAWDELKHIRQAIGFLVSFIHYFPFLLPVLVVTFYNGEVTVSPQIFTFSVQVIHQKPKKTLDEISHDLCPVSDVYARIKQTIL